eukprot:Awhi_evm1s13000
MKPFQLAQPLRKGVLTATLTSPSPSSTFSSASCDLSLSLLLSNAVSTSTTTTTSSSSSFSLPNNSRKATFLTTSSTSFTCQFSAMNHASCLDLNYGSKHYSTSSLFSSSPLSSSSSSFASHCSSNNSLPLKSQSSTLSTSTQLSPMLRTANANKSISVLLDAVFLNEEENDTDASFSTSTSTHLSNHKANQKLELLNYGDRKIARMISGTLRLEFLKRLKKNDFETPKNMMLFWDALFKNATSVKVDFQKGSSEAEEDFLLYDLDLLYKTMLIQGTTIDYVTLLNALGDYISAPSLHPPSSPPPSSSPSSCSSASSLFIHFCRDYVKVSNENYFKLLAAHSPQNLAQNKLSDPAEEEELQNIAAKDSYLYISFLTDAKFLFSATPLATPTTSTMVSETPQVILTSANVTDLKRRICKIGIDYHYLNYKPHLSFPHARSLYKSSLDSLLSLFQSIQPSLSLSTQASFYEKFLCFYHTVNPELCITLYQQMLRNNILPSALSLTYLIHVYSHYFNNSHKAIELHKQFLVQGFEPTQSVFESMVEVYVRNEMRAELYDYLAYLNDLVDDNVTERKTESNSADNDNIASSSSWSWNIENYNLILYALIKFKEFEYIRKLASSKITWESEKAKEKISLDLSEKSSEHSFGNSNSSSSLDSSSLRLSDQLSRIKLIDSFNIDTYRLFCAAYMHLLKVNTVNDDTLICRTLNRQTRGAFFKETSQRDKNMESYKVNHEEKAKIFALLYNEFYQMVYLVTQKFPGDIDFHNISVLVKLQQANNNIPLGLRKSIDAPSSSSSSLATKKVSSIAISTTPTTDTSIKSTITAAKTDDENDDLRKTHEKNLLHHQNDIGICKEITSDSHLMPSALTTASQGLDLGTSSMPLSTQSTKNTRDGSLSPSSSYYSSSSSSSSLPVATELHNVLFLCLSSFNPQYALNYFISLLGNQHRYLKVLEDKKNCTYSYPTHRDVSTKTNSNDNNNEAIAEGYNNTNNNIASSTNDNNDNIKHYNTKNNHGLFTPFTSQILRFLQKKYITQTYNPHLYQENAEPSSQSRLHQVNSQHLAHNDLDLENFDYNPALTNNPAQIFFKLPRRTFIREYEYAKSIGKPYDFDPSKPYDDGTTDERALTESRLKEEEFKKNVQQFLKSLNHFE